LVRDWKGLLKLLGFSGEFLSKVYASQENRLKSFKVDYAAHIDLATFHVNTCSCWLQPSPVLN